MDDVEKRHLRIEVGELTDGLERAERTGAALLADNAALREMLGQACAIAQRAQSNAGRLYYLDRHTLLALEIAAREVHGSSFIEMRAFAQDCFESLATFVRDADGALNPDIERRASELGLDVEAWKR